ncbi:hypothetical protein [Gottfriedia acidiceleris]|uniref:hypothetical protein n=1 Tax=Gottfriedia acidiceleris TaxID=371036 RepID=UPI00101CA876|nr:hypothetical protein [Gottfriedia acidiceleris]
MFMFMRNVKMNVKMFMRKVKFNVEGLKFYWNQLNVINEIVYESQKSDQSLQKAIKVLSERYLVLPITEDNVNGFDLNDINSMKKLGVLIDSNIKVNFSEKKTTSYLYIFLAMQVFTFQMAMKSDILFTIKSIIALVILIALTVYIVSAKFKGTKEELYPYHVLEGLVKLRIEELEKVQEANEPQKIEAV